MATATEENLEGTVTVLFTDVQGSTEMRNRLGDAAAGSILRAHEGLVRGQVEGHGGREVKALGDGFMVAFASARKAVACAVAIQKAFEAHNHEHPDGEVLVRIGLNSGEVSEQNGDLFGAAVNAASRIAAKADGGEVLVAEVVKQLAGKVQDVDFQDRGRFRLKGFDERWRLHEVIWQRQKVAARPVAAEEVAFVGRDAEKRLLMKHVDAAIAGHGALVMLGGEAGVGKTRLMSEVAAEAQAKGMLVLTGHCYEGEGSPPYITFLEILEVAIESVDRETIRTALGPDAGEIARIVPQLRRIYDDIPPPMELPADQERHYLFNSVRDFLARAASITPLMLVYEDLHWADESTLLLGEHIAQKLAELPVLGLGTYRDVELEVDRPLAHTLEKLLRSGLAERVSLKRLPAAGVEEMLKSLFGQPPPPALVAAIYEETEGNPFFVREVFNYLAEENRLFDEAGHFRSDLTIGELEVPESVRLVIGRRLQRLGDSGRKVLAGAAVMGREFNYRLLEAMAETDEDTLLDVIDEAERAHLIESIEGSTARFSFAHELIRQTLLTGLSLPRRQRLHLRAAQAMEQVYGKTADDHAPDLAHHFYQAGDAADANKTAHYLLLAADRAIEAAAFEDALVHLDNAASLDLTDRRLAADIQNRVGLAKRSLGFWTEATQAWDTALSLYEEVGDVDAVAALAANASEQMAWATRWVDAMQMAGRGLAAIGDDDSVVSADRCVLLSNAGLAFSGAGNYEVGETMIQQAEAIAAQLGDQRMVGRIGYIRCVHHWLYMEYDRGREVGYLAAKNLRHGGNLWWLSSGLAFLGFCCQLGRHPEEAPALLGESLELGLKVGNYGVQVTAARLTAYSELGEHGDMDRWERHAYADLELTTHIGTGIVADSHSTLGMLHYWKGDWDRAAEELALGAEMQSPGAYGGHGSMNMLYGAYMGRHEAARQWIAQNRDEFPRADQHGSMNAWMMAMSTVEALWLMDDREGVAGLYETALDAPKRGCMWRPWDARSFHVTAALCAAARGEWDLVDDLFVEAEPVLLRWPQFPGTLMDRGLQAQVLIERDRPGDRARATELLEQTIKAYKKLGMPRHVDMANALLANA